jgi:FMN phosphatase YigB (HAD superfamily)
MMSGTKAIFLDVGGTLVELGEPESAYADILDQYGYPATREQIGTWIRQAQKETGPVVSSGSGSEFKVFAGKEQARRENLIAVFLREAGVKGHFDSCRKEIWDSWVRTPVFRLFPETLPMLRGLKESGFLVGAVSNWEPRLQELCENLGIAQYFDFMVVSEVQGYAKPGTRLFELALERAATRPEEPGHYYHRLLSNISDQDDPLPSKKAIHTHFFANHFKNTPAQPDLR